MASLKNHIDGTSGQEGEFRDVIADRSISLSLRNKYVLPLDTPPGDNYFIVSEGTSKQLEWQSVSQAGLGDVIGPGSSINGNLCSFNGTTGKLIQDSGISSSGLLTNPLAQNLLMDSIFKVVGLSLMITLTLHNGL
jgi:hypothetical protein